MGYKMLCNNCGNEYERPYLSFSRQCPKCKSGDLTVLKPSKNAGCVILGIGLLFLGVFFIDLCSLVSAGPGGTIVGSLVKAFVGENTTAYRVVTTVVAAIGMVATIFGLGLTAGKRR
jgi:DNA-directed RNA polymerase subunit RPC12/RpoP